MQHSRITAGLGQTNVDAADNAVDAKDAEAEAARAFAAVFKIGAETFRERAGNSRDILLAHDRLGEGLVDDGGGHGAAWRDRFRVEAGCLIQSMQK